MSDQIRFEPGFDTQCLERVFGGQRRRLKASEQSLERSAIDFVGQIGGVLVLHPERTGMHPRSVIAAVAGDHRDFAELAAIAGEHFP